MKIIIAGASGFIGGYLIKALIAKNHYITALSRNPAKQQDIKNVIWKKWSDNDNRDWQAEFESSDIVINLIGESLAEGRWTKSRKQKLMQSRTRAADQFVEAYKKARTKPALYIQSSAIGYYAPAPSSNEKSPAGDDFPAEISISWEDASREIEQMGVNRIILRTGIVLARDSLLIKKFYLPFSLFIGGHLGNGQQTMSWIHIDDVVYSIIFMIENVKSSQIFNLTAPNPVTMKEFCKKFGKSINRPSWLHVPAFVLKIIFGQMAEETMLKGHKIMPENLLQSGFNFKYSEIDSALNNL